MHNTTTVRLAGLMLAAGGLWIGFTQQRSPRPLEIEHVRGNLHVIHGSGGNVGVLTTDEGVLLVDDKFERNVSEILNLVKSITSEPVRYVFNTHHHGDHTGGNELLSKKATIIIQENARANMTRAGQVGAPPLTFVEQQTLHLGGVEIRSLYYGRAHTNGDSVIYFPRLRAVHTGDMFVRGAPFVDYANAGSAREWDDTLNEVLQLEFDTVIPGHGPISSREDLTDWKADFEEFRVRISELADQKKSPEQAAELVRIDDFEGWSIGPLQKRMMPELLRELR